MINIKASLLNMEAYYRSSPYFADIDWKNPPTPPKNIPPRPSAPVRPPTHTLKRCDAISDPRFFAQFAEFVPRTAKKESD